MTATLLGAAAGAAAAVGLLLVVVAWWQVRRPTPAMRVDPYLSDLVPVRTRASSTVGAVYGPWLRGAAELVGRLTGGTASVERRLVRLGSPYGVDAFRVQQLAWFIYIYIFILSHLHKLFYILKYKLPFEI